MVSKELTGVSTFMEAKDEIGASRAGREENGKMGIIRIEVQL